MPSPQTRVMYDRTLAGTPQPYDQTLVPPRLKGARGTVDPRMREQVNPDVPYETCWPDMTIVPPKLVRRGGK